jgi:GTP-binding protein
VAAKTDDAEERARKLFAGPIDFLKSAPGLQFLPDATVPEIALCRPLQRRQELAAQRADQPQDAGPHVEHAGAHAGAQFLRRRQAAEAAAGRHAGYGFAEAPRDMVKRWRFLINDYLRGRQVLKRALVLVDSRHGLKPVDHDVMQMLDDAAVSYHVVLTKSDKPKRTELEAGASRHCRGRSQAPRGPSAHLHHVERNR